ncbi:MAG TPA: hypothetical protein VGD14_25085 [bacterium]
MRSIHPLISMWIVLSVIFIQGTNWSWANEDENLPTKSDHLGINVNCGLASYREDLVVPLGFHGLGLSFSAIYSRQTENKLLNARWRFGLGYMQNRYDHEALIIVQEIRSSWLKKFNVFEHYGEFWGGICLPLQMNNLFWGSWDDAHLYWLTAYGMGAAFQWQKKISSDKQALVRIEIPIINWVSRPPRYRYTKQEPKHHLSYQYSEPNKSLHFETLDDYQALFVQLLLRKEMKRSLLNLGIEFQYHHFSKPEDIWGLNTLLLFSYQWRIGS